MLTQWCMNTQVLQTGELDWVEFLEDISLVIQEASSVLMLESQVFNLYLR